MALVVVVAGQTDNLVQLATKLGATELVKLVTTAGLADTLAGKVRQADQKASNGVIHVLGKVMFPIPEGSVVDLVAKEKMLSTLLKA
nr:hypothetical protein BaRGS_034784 [Batillaria attramentaria]